jgi:hypothetical protein
MHGPPLVAWLLVALSVAAAAACLVRREAGDEALMGAGMAVMAVPMSVLDPWPWGAAPFAAVFAGATVRALLRARHRRGHHLHHAVCSAAMVYMAVAMAGAGASHTGHAGHAGHAAAGLPVLTGLLLAYFAAYALRAGMLLVAAPAPGGRISAAAATAGGPGSGPAGPLGSGVPASAGRRRHAPEVAIACRVSMALGMLAMLLAL